MAKCSTISVQTHPRAGEPCASGGGDTGATLVGAEQDEPQSSRPVLSPPWALSWAPLERSTKREEIADLRLWPNARTEALQELLVSRKISLARLGCMLGSGVGLLFVNHLQGKAAWAALCCSELTGFAGRLMSLSQEAAFLAVTIIWMK